ncbi:MAG: nucleotide exchange factor GrpE [Bauldia sp.]|nr:nucleotide exchange factor GrpE [Bauldia sp.]
MMADETTPETEPDAPAQDAGEGPAAADETEALRAEAADLKNKLLRTLAEMENLRRRTEREMADARQYAVANFARDMLTVSDNFRRAIDAVPSELRDGRDPALSALIEGVEVTERGLEQSLQKFGVRRIETKGQKFDPAVHQAMLEVESEDVAPGTVAQEIQGGYVIGERVLRPALVAIAKRPSKAAAVDPAAGPSESPANDA